MSTSPLNKGNANQALTGIGTILIIAGLGGIYQFLMPNLITAKTASLTAQAQVANAQASVQTLTQAQTALKNAQATLLAQGVDITTADKVVPIFEDVPGLYLQMEALVQSAQQVSKVNYIIGIPTTDPTGVKVPITVSAVGRYADLHSFIATLESMPRPLILSSLTFGQATGGDPKNTAGTLTLTVTGYARARSLSPAYQPTTATK